MKNIGLLKNRAAILKSIREFFWNEGFLETDTPALVYSPGMEPHIRPIQVGSSFLQTSPEFAMKKILASGAGTEKIFQICKCYRSEPKSSTHHPEFTMIEWYRANSTYEDIMNDCEKLFESIAFSIYGKTKFKTVTGIARDVSGPWERISIQECFTRFADLNLLEFINPIGGTEKLTRACLDHGWITDHYVDSNKNKPGFWDDLFFLVMMNKVEPAVAALGKPVILYHYPESQAALSNLETDASGIRWAKRFELYAGGFELANAFDELTDAEKQRERFERDMKLRAEIYNFSGSENQMPIAPIDEEFLAALTACPPSGGIALGVDRLVQYFLGVDDIKEVLWQESHF